MKYGYIYFSFILWKKNFNSFKCSNNSYISKYTVNCINKYNYAPYCIQTWDLPLLGSATNEPKM